MKVMKTSNQCVLSDALLLICMFAFVFIRFSQYLKQETMNDVCLCHD